MRPASVEKGPLPPRDARTVSRRERGSFNGHRLCRDDHAKRHDLDRALANELRADEKERAEHTMLVDLGRNDVARVCEPASIRLERVMEVEPTSIHQRCPLIFGSASEVRLVEHYYAEAHALHERPPLFGERGLFRTG